MNNSQNKNLLTEGSIWKKLMGFAFPLFLGNLFQQLYNTADSLIVGNFLGSDALAAVSSSGSLTFLLSLIHIWLYQRYNCSQLDCGNLCSEF